jgi:hypothetical protein
MSTRHRQLAAVITLVSLAGIGLAGCSSPETTPAPSASSSTSLVAPIMVDLKTANGTAVAVSMSNIVNLLTGDTTVTDWTGVVADPKIATFIDGKVEGGATFNPAVSPKSEGTTKVTVTNSATGAVVTFDLTVTM